MPSKLFFSCLLILNACFAQTNQHLLIGTYTSGKSEGIYIYNFNPANGDHSLAGSVKTINPSYLAVSPDQKTVYAVNETSDTTSSGIGGGVSAFSYDKAQSSLTLMNTESSGGKDPCYVTVDKSGKWLFVANYSSGSSALYSVKKTGELAPAKQVIQDSGSGPNKDRQEGPHAHSTVLSPDNKYLFIQDLGIDKILVYHFDNIKGKLVPAKPAFVPLAGGSGPRHFDFHPNKRYAYLMTEMTGSVVVYQYGDGKLKAIQQISALPADFKGAVGSADIHVSSDGRFVYCSNRGESNSITIFKVNQQNGKLTVAGYQSALGKTPRNFNFDPSGNFMLVANQHSDDVIIFRINKKTGLLTDTGKRIDVPNPVCIKWIR